MDPKLDGESFFKDFANPTKEELTKWAYADAYAPCEDFELFVVNDPELTLALAADEKNPSQSFFLGSLYVFAGDCVRVQGEGSDEQKGVLQKLLLSAEKSASPQTKKFVEKVRDLLANPQSYTYEKWGIGGEYSAE